MNIWIGSPIDVKHGADADAANKLCNDKKYWNDKEGIVKVDYDRWLQAQKFEKDGWTEYWYNCRDDRPMEHYNLFNSYSDVPHDIGAIVEFGCGPFTQLKHIIEFGNRQFSSITLVDPLINDYLNMDNCTYKDNSLLGCPVEFFNCQAEKFTRSNYYDTAICINVLEHVQDVLAVLDKLHDTLKTGGLIIFGERTYDDFNCDALFDIGHPIRIKSCITDEFKKRFNILFDNVGYFIGIKK